jgi:hemolysin activation/secretion protein
VDGRKFNKVEMTGAPPLYNQIVVTPLSVAYATQGRLGKGDVNFNGSFALNIPGIRGGKAANFANYDKVSLSSPTPHYKVLRYGAGYFNAFDNDWQFRSAVNGQWSGDALIQGEQMRLGGADGVRGFSEGSETGEIGARLNLEVYAPEFEKKGWKLRPLVFLDGGVAKLKGANPSPTGFVTSGSVTAYAVDKTSTISSAGFGLRSAYSESASLRLDVGRIMKAGGDPQQAAGDWRIHASMLATF